MNRHLQSAVGSAAAFAGHTVRLARTGARYLPGWTGAALVSLGAWQAWHPAGPIVAGVFLLAMDAMIPAHRRTAGGD